MAQDEARTDTPEYGCFSDLAAEQAATAEAPKKAGKTDTPADASADQE
ncbi:hypothetical protein [Novosphingobium sp.]|nr:hypothetical protein [Novosphingobium sp.]